MFLNHAAGTAYMRGLHVLEATLELPEPLVMQRLVANLTGMPISAVGECGNTAIEKLEEVLAGILVTSHPGPQVRKLLDELRLSLEAKEQPVGGASDRWDPIHATFRVRLVEDALRFPAGNPRRRELLEMADGAARLVVDLEENRLARTRSSASWSPTLPWRSICFARTSRRTCGPPSTPAFAPGNW